MRSGIQSPQGGVARYYRIDLGRYAAVSAEITGYAASTLVYLYRRTGRAEYLDAGIRAARFLARDAWNPELGVIPFEYPWATANGVPPAYFFDCGIIVRGLLAVWRECRDSELLEAAVRTGRSMAHEFVRGGVIHPVVLLPEKRPAPHEARWSREPGCFQLKSAMGWEDLFEATGDAGFRSWYEEAFRSALVNHAGFLPGPDLGHAVMDRLHAYCYFLEGLSPRASRPDGAQTLRDGIERVAAMLRDISPEFERSDVCAQLLRLRLYAHGAGILPLDAAAAREEAARTAAYQLDFADVRLAGAYGFGRKGGEALPFANPVSTVFAMQALDQWARFQLGEFSSDRHELI